MGCEPSSQRSGHTSVRAPEMEAVSLFARAVLQDVVGAERVVLAGAALVPRRPGLGRPGGPGRPRVRQSSGPVGGAAHCTIIPYHSSTL